MRPPRRRRSLASLVASLVGHGGVDFVLVPCVSRVGTRKISRRRRRLSRLSSAPRRRIALLCLSRTGQASASIFLAVDARSPRYSPCLSAARCLRSGPLRLSRECFSAVGVSRFARHHDDVGYLSRIDYSLCAVGLASLARRHNGVALRSRVFRVGVLTCALGVVGPPSHRSSWRQRRSSLFFVLLVNSTTLPCAIACSRSRMAHRRAPCASSALRPSLVDTAALFFVLASFASACQRALLVSSVLHRFAHRHDGVALHSLSLCSLTRRRRSSLSRRFTRRYSGVARRSRVVRVFASTCALGVVGPPSLRSS